MSVSEPVCRGHVFTICNKYPRLTIVIRSPDQLYWLFWELEAKVHVLHQKQKYFYGGTALFKLCTIRIPIVNTMLRFVVPTIENKILFTYCLLLTFTNQCTWDSDWDVEQRFQFAKRKPIKCGQLARNDGMGQGAGQLQASHQPPAAVLTSPALDI